MKKLGFFIGLLFGLTAHSQISINSTHMPQSGDTLRYSTATLDTAVLLNYRAPGANLTWDFSGLIPRQQAVQQFVASSQTPYANSVPNRIGLLFADTLSFGGFSIFDAYNFINSTTTDFSIDYRGATAPTGLSFPFPSTVQLVGSYSDKDEVFQFPLDYNDRDSSTFNFVYNNALLGVYYGSSGYRINEVDAWGSLTTPYGTFNCIRVVTDMVSFDTISFSGQNFGIPSHTREYQWISDQIKIPALKVNGNVVAGIFIPTTVEYRDSVRNVVPIFPTIALFTADTTVVEVNKELDFTNFSIGSTSFQWDFTPSTVSYKTGSSNSRNITVSFQDTGLYDVRLIAMGGNDADTLLRSGYIRVVAASGGNKPQADFLADTSVVSLRTDYTIYNKSQTKTNASFEWLITPRSPIAPVPFTYKNGTNSTSMDSIVVNFADTGFFDVRLIATDDFGKDTIIKTDFVYVRIPVGLTEVDVTLSKMILVHPNPVTKNNRIVVEFQQQLTLYSLQIYDIKGRIVEEENYQTTSTQVNHLIEQPSGVYFIRLVTDQGIALKKVVVE